MKVYIDLQKLAISKVVDATSPEYAGDINSNVFEILFFNYDNTNWFPTMSQLAPNGREAGDFEADSLGVGETHDYTEEGVNYQRFTFTMGNAWVLMKGRSNLFVWYNVLNGAVLKKCVGKLNVMLNESSDNYFISNPVFNPAVKSYIEGLASDIEDELNDKVDAQNATIASLMGGEPRYVNTSSNILALTTNQGVAVATDTGHWYYWNGTQYVDGGVFISDTSYDLIKYIIDNNISLIDIYNTEITTGQYVNYQDGVFYDLEPYQRTDYINIKGLTKILVKKTFHYPVDGFAFYDENKLYISGAGGSATEINGYILANVPDGACYFATCGFTTDILGVYTANIQEEISKILDMVDINPLDIYPVNNIISNIKNATSSSGEITIDATNNQVTINYTSTTGNQWLTMPVSVNKIIDENIVHIRFNLDTLNTGNTLRIYIEFRDTNNNVKYISLGVISSTGLQDLSCDLNYYVVYESLDMTKAINILIANESAPCYAVLTNPIIYEKITELDTDKTIGENLNEMEIKIQSNENSINNLNDLVRGEIVSPNGTKYITQVLNDGTLITIPKLPSKILYIGNSLLLGFGTFGMAATNSNQDYYHYVNDYLTNLGLTLTTDKLQGALYEACTSSSEQDAWLQNALLSHLSNDIELVIIQLGDNVNTPEKLAVFENGAKKLIEFIRTNVPRTRVAWVGEWYSTAIKQTYISNACKDKGATFIDISQLPSGVGNKSYVGAVWIDDNNVEHTITDSGVASHPSSQGMRKIADLIIENLFE